MPSGSPLLHAGRSPPEAGRTLRMLWANPWAFALYGLLLSLPLLVLTIRANVGTVNVAAPVLWGVGSVAFLWLATRASALRIAERGVVIPDGFRTLGNLWRRPEFVPWTAVSGVRSARGGVVLDLAGGGAVVLRGYHRTKLERALKETRPPPAA